MQVDDEPNGIALIIMVVIVNLLLYLGLILISQ